MQTRAAFATAICCRVLEPGLGNPRASVRSRAHSPSDASASGEPCYHPAQPNYFPKPSNSLRANGRDALGHQFWKYPGATKSFWLQVSLDAVISCQGAKDIKEQ